MWIPGACWASACVLRALLPTQSPALPSPTPHFQGDSSFVIMTNFIVTPHQAQGYCAEVRTATHPLSPLPGPQGKITWKRKSAWTLKIGSLRAMLWWNFRHRFTQSNSLLLAVRLPSQLCVKQDAEPWCPPNPQALTSLLPAR